MPLDARTGIVRGEEALSFADENAPFLCLPLLFRLIRPAEFVRLAGDAGFVVEPVHADFTTAPYRESQGGAPV